MTTLVLLVITGVAYAIAVGGLSLALGGWIGWAAFTIGSAIPAAYLLAKSAEDRSIASDISAQGGETYRPPPSPDGPEPIPRPQAARYD